MMLTEITITSKEAFEAMQLIEAYMESNGEGFDRDRLQRVFDALSEADRVVIETDAQRAERENHA